MRTLGVERFGALVFMQGAARYGTVLVDYGFNLTGPRDVARAAADGDRARVFSSIMACRLILFGCVTVMAAVLIFAAGALGFSFDAKLFWASYAAVSGSVVFPVWFFQGIQRMHFISFFNLAAQALSLLLVLFLVAGPDDCVLAALLLSCELPAAGCFSPVLLVKKFRCLFVVPSLREIRQAFAGGFAVFTSTVAINIYTTTNTVVLGLITNDTVVGCFGAASRLIDCVKGLMSAFNQAVYPFVTSRAVQSREAAVRLVRKFLFAYAGSVCAAGCFLFGFAPDIVRFFFGPGHGESAYLLRLMAFLPFIISVSNVYGIQVMLNFGLQRAFNRIICSGSALDLLLVVPLVHFFQGAGSALVMLIVEAWITAAMYMYVERVRRIRIL